MVLTQNIYEVSEQVLAEFFHEIRTPLNAIIGYAEILQNDLDVAGKPSEKQGYYASNISKSGKYILNMAQDMLDLAATGSTINGSSRADWVEIKKLLAEIKDMLNLLAEQSQVNLIFEVQSDLKYVYTDKTALKRVLLNLLSNAIKFNRPNGDAKLKIFRSIKNDVEYAVCEIEDNGTGISKNELDLIFTPFYRSVCSNKKQSEGVGLGLALTKKLIESLGGAISVESEESKGSIFRFKLPLH